MYEFSFYSFKGVGGGHNLDTIESVEKAIRGWLYLLFDPVENLVIHFEFVN